MSMRVLFFSMIVVVCTACASEVATPSHEAPADVIYLSGGTHEVWERFDEATILGTEAMGPQLTAPTGSLTRSGPAPTFTWTESEALLEERMLHRAKGTLPSRSRLTRIVDDLLHPVAHAHTPVTGDMYRVVFSIPGVETPVRLITGETSYTPSEEAWGRISAATGPITLTLEYAYLETGRISDGPYRGPVVTLTFE